MVIDGQDIRLASGLFEKPHLGQDAVQGVARLSVGQVFAGNGRPPAAGDQVIEARSLDALGLEELKQSFDVLDVPFGQRQSQADPHPGLLAVANSL